MTSKNPAKRDSIQCLFRARHDNLLPAVLRAHLPATSISSEVRQGGIPRPIIWGPIGHCASPIALPHSQPPSGLQRFGRATAHYVHRSSAGGDGVPASAGNSVGTGWRSPPPFVPLPAIQLRSRTQAKSRVSIETGECNFPGINIPRRFPQNFPFTWGSAPI